MVRLFCGDGTVKEKKEGEEVLVKSGVKITKEWKKMCIRDQVVKQSMERRVTVQQVQGRQEQSYAGTGYKGNGTSSGGNTIGGQARAAWFKEKAMLSEALESGQILDEEQLAFLADPGILDGHAAQATILNNAAFQTEDLDAYDSDCDDVSNAKAVLMANLSNYGYDVILEVPHSEPYHNDMDNQSVHAMQDFEQTPVVDFTDNEITSDSNIISYSQYLQETNQATVNKKKNNESITTELERYKERVKTFEQRLNIDLTTREKMIDSQMDDMIKEKHALKKQIDSLEQNLSNQIKEKESLLQTFTDFKNKSKEKKCKYMDKEIDLEKKIKELDNIVYKKAQQIKPTLYDGGVISSKHAASPVIDDEETLILEEMRSKQPRAINDQRTYQVIRFYQLSKVSLVNESFKKLKFHLVNFDSVVKIRTTPDALTEDLLNEIMEVQTVFNQMEAAVQQCSVGKQCCEIVKKELFLENDRLLQKIMSQDVLLSVMNSITLNGESNVEKQRSESCHKCFNLDAELSKTQNAYNNLLKKYFENNDLKAQLHAKDTTIYKLKEHIKSMRENDKEEKVKQDMDEIETINIELEHSVAKLLFENERLHKEIDHLKQNYKDQFDSIKRTRVHTKEHFESLILQLNSKSVENADLKAQIQDKVFVITS
ncbi:hypothetical protein Tco_0120714 [Tanacetum coccineum]